MSASGTKRIVVELAFVPPDEPAAARTRTLVIPNLRAARDVLHLEAALWNMAREDSELDRRIGEQEQIFFSSKLDFVFFGESKGVHVLLVSITRYNSSTLQYK